jgi:hypothetical protein
MTGVSLSGQQSRRLLPLQTQGARTCQVLPATIVHTGNLRQTMGPTRILDGVLITF